MTRHIDMVGTVARVWRYGYIGKCKEAREQGVGRGNAAEVRVHGERHRCLEHMG